MQLTQPQKQFLEWLRQYDAPLHAVAIEQLKILSGGGGLGAINPLTASAPLAEPSLWDRFTTGFSNAVDSISGALSKALPVYADYKISKVEVDRQILRAQQGLAPLPSIAPTYQELPPFAQPQVRIIARETIDAPMPVAQMVTNALPWAVGAFALWAVTSKKKGG